MFGEYAQMVKIGMYVALFGMLLAAVKGYHNWMDESIRATVELEYAAAQAEKDKVYEEKIKLLEAAKAEVPPPTTVTEIIEVITYVDKVIEKEVFICDDLGDNFVRVRNTTRDCIFNSSDGGRECLQ